MKGERALLLTRRAHAFFGTTSCPDLPLLIGFFRHYLYFPVSPPLMAAPLLTQLAEVRPLLSQPAAAASLQGVSGMPSPISVSTFSG